MPYEYKRNAPHIIMSSNRKDEDENNNDEDHNPNEDAAALLLTELAAQASKAAAVAEAEAAEVESKAAVITTSTSRSSTSTPEPEAVTAQAKGKEETEVEVQSTADAPPTPPVTPPPPPITPPVVAFKPPNELAWDARVSELLDYKAVHGDCDVPNTHEDNPSLARWVGDQRRSYKRGAMAQHRIDRLNEIGFVWNKDRKAPWKIKWDKRFEELQKYMYKYGQIGVTLNGNVHPQWHALNEWAHVQRKRRKEDKLSNDLVARLDSIHFLWDVDDFVWEKHFKLLVQVQTQHKNPDDASAFRKWVSKQRELHRDGVLAPDRVAKLNSVHFHWGSGNNMDDEDGYHEHDRSDSTTAGGSDDSDPSDDAGVRANHHSSSSSSRLKRHHLMTKATSKRRGGVSSAAPDSHDHARHPSAASSLGWDEHLKALAAYKRKHGDCHVPPEYTKHPTLAAWCKEIRGQYRRRELASDRITRLKKMGFRWANRKSGPKASWDERFAQLCDLLREHRGMEGLLQYAAAAESLRRKTEEPSLLETIVSWVDYQRVLRKHSKLDPDRIERLTNVGLVWDAHQAAWDARFEQLVRHMRDGTKPRDYASYVKWEHRQRREHRLGTLHPDRVDRLNGVGFRWEPRPQRRRSSAGGGRASSRHASMGGEESPPPFAAGRPSGEDEGDGDDGEEEEEDHGMVKDDHVPEEEDAAAAYGHGVDEEDDAVVDDEENEEELDEDHYDEMDDPADLVGHDNDDDDDDDEDEYEEEEVVTANDSKSSEAEGDASHSSGSRGSTQRGVKRGATASAGSSRSRKRSTRR